MVITAVVLIAIAIMLGAFGAHGLKNIVEPEKVVSFDKGVRYQFYTAFGMLMLGLNADKFLFSLKSVFVMMLTGMLLFSISIYFLSLQDYLGVKLSFLGPITPLGGVLMITAWITLAVKLMKSK